MLTWLLLTGAASAQEVPELNAQLYRPPIDAEQTLWTDDASTAPDGYYMARVSTSYARNPLVFLYDDGEVLGLLTNVVQTDLIGAYYYKQVRVGLDLPLFLLASGTAGPGTGLGDIALDVKGTLVRAETAPVGLAVGGRLGLPTATSTGPVGSPGVSGELQAIASQQVGPVQVAANIGTRFLPETALGNMAWNDQFFYRLGGGYEVVEGIGASLDISGLINYTEPVTNPASSPAEFLAGGWYRAMTDYVVRAGLGSGLNSGIGAPDFRLIVGVAYEPARVFDRDLDGIVDHDDACPDSPEDFDEYQDADGCPDQSASVSIEIVDPGGEFVYNATSVVSTEFGPREGSSAVDLLMHPGDYTIEVSADRYAPLTETFTVPEAPQHNVRLTMVPTFGMLQVTVLGPEGEPLTSTARVGEDSCVTEAGPCEMQATAGESTLEVTAEGYKPHTQPVTVQAGEQQAITVTLEAARAVMTNERIEISEKVYFDTNRTTIQSESFPLLDEVAELLRQHPEVTLLRVEGHTDSRGSARSNLRLSQGRSDAVRQYLVDRGVEGERLISQGFGEDNPINPAQTDEAYETNRRVEFVIINQENSAEQGENE